MNVNSLMAVLTKLQEQGFGDKEIYLKDKDDSSTWSVCCVSVSYFGAGKPSIYIEPEI